MKPELLDLNIDFNAMSDSYGEGGFSEAESVDGYLIRFQVGLKTLTEVIIEHENSPHPINCIIFDAFFPCALEVAEQFGIVLFS
ncbi:hypothetical protein V6N13_080095 [Hibiscus sabdariffa]